LAALQSSPGFEGKAGLRTWLIGILKHKIADYWRRHAREETLLAFEETDEVAEHGDDMDFFNSKGAWNSGPKTWSPRTAKRIQGL
jgi:RNA polymerase sigma-70 factor, ECF subfamily